MRISDWSSDVCSSDLAYPDLNNWPTILAGVTFTNLFWHTEQLTPNAWSLTFEVIFYSLTCLAVTLLVKKRNWLLGDRKSVVEGKSVSVRDDLGGCLIL